MDRGKKKTTNIQKYRKTKTESPNKIMVEQKNIKQITNAVFGRVLFLNQ